MKKIVLFIFLSVLYISTGYAQTVTLPAMGDNTYQLVTSDYVLTNTTVRTFVFTAPQDAPCTQDYIVNLDSTSGNHTNVAVSLWGQKSAYRNDSTQVGSTVNWKGVSRDTTFIISNATANRYRIYKVRVAGTGTGTTTVDTQELKLYKE